MSDWDSIDAMQTLRLELSRLRVLITVFFLAAVPAMAQVNFGRHGMKWLALGVAKLTPVD